MSKQIFESADPIDELVLYDPALIEDLKHKIKSQILSVLVNQQATIYELKNKLNLNPGVVKRHIDDLLEKGFIQHIRETSETKNSMGMSLKYYRARAKKFVVNVHYEWIPEKMS